MNWIERDIHEDGDDHDIGLNLTLELKCPSQNSPQPKPSLNDIAFQSSSASKGNGFQGAVMNNMLAANIVTEPPVVSSSPGITISSGNGKRSNRDESGLEPQSNSSEGGGDDDSSAKKKLRLTKEQAAILEETFRHQCTLSQSQKIVLARQLSLQTRQVEVWFQNRRARTKFKKTEVDCAYLRRRCEDLAEENRRLQKEVAELRALKFLANVKQPTTLTMCPQCERLGKVPVSSPIAPDKKRQR